MNYTVFDVETANSQRDSVCSIGIIRCEEGKIVYENEFLINPEAEFDFYNSRVHGITESDVADAPTFPQVWEKIKQYFEHTILVAHNAKSMDLCALYRMLERYNLSVSNNEYICTLELARKILKGENPEQSYRLDVLANKYNIMLANHHNALDDARACYELLRIFEEQYPKEVVVQQYCYDKSSKDKCRGNSIEGIYSDKTKQMQKLQEIVIKSMKDNIISDEEVIELKRWLENHIELRGFYPFDIIFDCVEKIMSDDVMDDNEMQTLLGVLDAFVNPQTVNVEVEFLNKTVCLSGEFKCGSKKEVEDILTKRGAMVVKSVTSKLDILILGEAGSAAWKYGNYGSKYEKAYQLNEKGKSIIIVKESDVI